MSKLKDIPHDCQGCLYLEDCQSVSTEPLEPDNTCQDIWVRHHAELGVNHERA